MSRVCRRASSCPLLRRSCYRARNGSWWSSTKVVGDRTDGSANALRRVRLFTDQQDALGVERSSSRRRKANEREAWARRSFAFHVHRKKMSHRSFPLRWSRDGVSLQRRSLSPSLPWLVTSRRKHGLGGRVKRSRGWQTQPARGAALVLDAAGEPLVPCTASLSLGHADA